MGILSGIRCGRFLCGLEFVRVNYERTAVDWFRDYEETVATILSMS